MTPDSNPLPVALTVFQENLLCVRGALGELNSTALDASDEFNTEEITQSRTLFERCNEGLRTGQVAMTETEVRLVQRALRLVEARWAMHDRQNLSGVSDSDWRLTVMLVDGAVD